MLSELQRLLVQALQAGDPAAWLSARQDRRALAAGERELLASLDPDGLRLTGLLVRKLRFERLLRGAARMRAAFAADPAAFVLRFDRYAREVPPAAVFPAEEVRAFEEFEACRTGRPRPAGPQGG